MKKIVGIIFMLVVGFAKAQAIPQALFEKANQAYQSEAYDKAIVSYQEILRSGLQSTDLYFNLANAHYKTNQIAEAIYYYEKALLLDPSNQDAKLNLAYANRSIVDSIKRLPTSSFKKFNSAVLTVFSYNGWAKIAVALSLFATLFWLFFFFSTLPKVKKTFFTVAIIMSVFCLLVLSVTIQQYNNTTANVFAIVFKDEVMVKNAPMDSASQTFVLHKGTKLKVLDEVGNWQKIKIADGQIGWLLKKTIKKL